MNNSASSFAQGTMIVSGNRDFDLRPFVYAGIDLPVHLEIFQFINEKMHVRVSFDLCLVCKPWVLTKA